MRPVVAPGMALAALLAWGCASAPSPAPSPAPARWVIEYVEVAAPHRVWRDPVVECSLPPHPAAEVALWDPLGRRFVTCATRVRRRP